MIDLHLHSNRSDGTDSPADVVALAVKAGVTTFALTDHDTTAGWAEAEAAMRDAPAGTQLVRGAEFSTKAPCGHGGTVSAHLLGYLFDPGSRAILADQERLRGERRERMHTMATRMRDGGYAVDPDELLGRLDPDAPIGRPHLARALMDIGAVGSVPEAFATLLAKDGPFYVPKQDTPIEQTVETIRAAGGVPVWAHPWGRARVEPSVIRTLAERGLAGLEVDHREHDREERGALRALAGELGLAVTGSSDYHGDNKPNGIGENTTKPEALAALLGQATGARVVTGGQ